MPLIVSYVFSWGTFCTLTDLATDGKKYRPSVRGFFMGVDMYLRWLSFLPASLAFDIFGRLLTPLVVLFADKDGWLPSWLWWWQTPDNSIDGDAGHLARWGTSTAPLAAYVRRVA